MSQHRIDTEELPYLPEKIPEKRILRDTRISFSRYEGRRGIRG